MMLRFALLIAALAAPASALKGGLKAGSNMGSKLLTKARRLDGEIDFGWIADYSIKFHKCHSLIQVADEAQAEGGMLYTQNLVTFQLCPSESCSSSNRGSNKCSEYVVGMADFVEAYTEAKREEAEQRCENIAENCDCENANDDDACANQCYIDAGYEDCIEVEDEEEFEVERYMECAELEGADGDGNNNWNYNGDNNYAYNQYFVGPYCSDSGYEILLGVYYDEGCTAKAKENDIFEFFNYGKSLPYSKESIVQNDCMSCLEPDDNDNDNQNNNNNNGNNNNDQEDEDRVIDFCEALYEDAGKCEKNLANNIAYADETGCDYINKVLPRLEQNSKSITRGSSGNTAAVVLAWVFGFTTLALGIYAFLLFRKLRRTKVNLSEQGNSEMN